MKVKKKLEHLVKANTLKNQSLFPGESQEKFRLLNQA